MIEGLLDTIRGRKKRKDRQASVKEDPRDKFRQLASYQRLQEKFGERGVDVSSGLKADSLTIGDITDIFHLYSEAAGSNLWDQYGSITRLARRSLDSLSADARKEAEGELRRISSLDLGPDVLDRDNPLYGLTVDLKTVIEEDRGFYELSHYPGGIGIEERRREGGFGIMLTNRQQMDDIEMIRPLFEEVGLPVRS